jgi:hypothetical protein
VCKGGLCRQDSIGALALILQDDVQGVDDSGNAV